MGDRPNKLKDQPITHDDLTIRHHVDHWEAQGAEHPEGAADQVFSADQTQFVPIGGPRSGSAQVGGTEDAGIDPHAEIPDAG